MRYLVYNPEKDTFTEAEKKPALENQEYFLPVAGTDFVVRSSDYFMFMAALEAQRKQQDVRMVILGKGLEEWKFLERCPFDMGIGIARWIEDCVRLNARSTRESFKDETQYERLAGNMCHNNNGTVASIRFMVEYLEQYIAQGVATEEQLKRFAPYVEPYFLFNLAYMELSGKLEPLMKEFMGKTDCDGEQVMARLRSDMEQWQYDIRHGKKEEKEEGL